MKEYNEKKWYSLSLNKSNSVYCLESYDPSGVIIILIAIKTPIKNKLKNVFWNDIFFWIKDKPITKTIVNKAFGCVTKAHVMDKYNNTW